MLEKSNNIVIICICDKKTFIKEVTEMKNYHKKLKKINFLFVNQMLFRIQDNKQ